MVPAFSAWVGLPLKDTIATSLACVGIFAIPGTLTHWYLGHIDWTFAIALAVGAIPGARIGAHITIGIDRPDVALRVGPRSGIIAIDLRSRRDRRLGQVASAAANTASSISGVSRPVNVFCWLG